MVLISLLSAALVFVPPTQVSVITSYISPGGVRPEPLRRAAFDCARLRDRDALPHLLADIYHVE
ncbi:MAG: hypothetical protein R2911_37960 [Caldilineaceae bacterium]